MIYVDPPYGIKFGTNWQVSARKRDVKDGKLEDASREVEQIKAFRDTWELGIHSYLTYLRDRLAVRRDLLTESGSIFVQIGDENVHLVRSLDGRGLRQRELRLADHLQEDIECDAASDYCSRPLRLSSLVREGLGTSASTVSYIRARTLGGAGARHVHLDRREATVERRRCRARFDYRRSRLRRRLSDPSNEPASDRRRIPGEFEGTTFLPTRDDWKTTMRGHGTS